MEDELDKAYDSGACMEGLNHFSNDQLVPALVYSTSNLRKTTGTRAWIN